jgi:uracil phosphoribosyltransferase
MVWRAAKRTATCKRDSTATCKRDSTATCKHGTAITQVTIHRQTKGAESGGSVVDCSVCGLAGPVLILDPNLATHGSVICCFAVQTHTDTPGMCYVGACQPVSRKAAPDTHKHTQRSPPLSHGQAT